MATELHQERRRSLGYWLAAALLILLAALLAGLWSPLRGQAAIIAPSLWQLPKFALWSLWRMIAAYVLSLLFALGVGIYAARRPRAGKFILPLLDILQSIPIVSFFPVALAVGIRFLGGGRIGFEIAAIVLIFTSMAWNMAFSVYDSVRSMPLDTLECAESFGVRGVQRLVTITLPACIPGLLNNSILSWAAGWFALTACEILTVGSHNVSLPGLGAFLAQGANSSHPLLMNVVGVGALLLVVCLLDFFIWRPLGVWAERFRYEMTVAATPHGAGGMLGWYQRGWAPRLLMRHIVVPLQRLTTAAIRQVHGSARRIVLPRIAAPPLMLRCGEWALRLMGWGLAGGIAIGGIYYAGRAIYGHEPVALAWDIPKAIGLSFLRILLAYILSLLWTVPLVLWAAKRPRILRALSSVSQILASLPAIAWTFVAVGIFVIWLHWGRFWGVEFAGLVLLMNGVQWYVLFNMLGGVSRVPGDLLEACDALGLSSWLKFKNLMLPAILPSLLTGTVTAFGGGWNTLIFSESISYAQQYYPSLGIGWLLNVASTGSNPPTAGGQPLAPGQSAALLLLSLACLIVFIVVFNRLVWKRLQAWAADRFRIDY